MNSLSITSEITPINDVIDISRAQTPTIEVLTSQGHRKIDWIDIMRDLQRRLQEADCEQ